MGKKHNRNRKNSKGDDDDEYEHEGNNFDDDAVSPSFSSSPPKQSFKDLKTFAEKREWQRQQAAQKRKAKQRCYLCGQWGHVRRECPGIADDGRGMSRFKNKTSNPKNLKEKRQQEKERQQRERQLQQTKMEDRTVEAEYFETVDFPEGFTHPPDEEDETGDGDHDHDDPQMKQEESKPPLPSSSSMSVPYTFYDPHCRVVESIDYMQSHRDSKKNPKNDNKKQNHKGDKQGNKDHKAQDSSSVTAHSSSTIREYQAIWNRAIQATGLGGIVVPTTVQRHKPWTNPIPWLCHHHHHDSNMSEEPAEQVQQEEEEQQPKATTSRHVPILFALGLAPSTPCTTEAEQADAKKLLLNTLNDPANANQIVALWGVLDYTKPKRTRTDQLARLQCLLEVALTLSNQLTLQIQVLPGIPSELASLDASVAGTDYAQALLDFQATLAKHLEGSSKQSNDTDNNTAGSSSSNSLLKIHLVGWQGRSDHTLSLLKAFSPNGPYPCHLVVGLDPTVTFSKATSLHELAFEIPMVHNNSSSSSSNNNNMVVLETSSRIPSTITKRLGRLATPHAAWWPFVAEAFAKHSKKYTAAEVTLAVNETIETLYPALVQAKSANSEKEETA